MSNISSLNTKSLYVSLWILSHNMFELSQTGFGLIEISSKSTPACDKVTSVSAAWMHWCLLVLKTDKSDTASLV